MSDDDLLLSTTVNTHYLDRVMDLAEERHVAATEDIFDTRGTKLVAKGTRISVALKEKLIVHKLKKSLESCLALQDGIDTRIIVAEARRLAETLEPIGYILGQASRGGRSPLDVLADIKFGSAMSMMLTLTERGGPAALTHSVMVSMLSICLASKLGLSMQDQSNIALAGLLHDIGELYIEPKYLHPEKRLLPNEWRHVMVHPRVGQMLILQLENYPGAVARAVGEHHERFDGAGYPTQVGGQNISVAGQILSVAEMISELLVEADSPLERAELALKIIPNEHAYQLVSAISNTMQVHPSTTRISAMPTDEANERAKVLFDHISVVVETGEKMVQLPRLSSSKAKDLLDHTIKRIDVIQRAFFSTGLDSCEREDTALSSDILFEAIVATEEIQWRLRDVARDLALRSAALAIDEAEAFHPLIAMLDAEPDERSLVRRVSGQPRGDVAAPPPAREANAAPRTRTLLMVDDESSVLLSLTRLLRPFGFRILTAPDAVTALEILAKNEVGVILSDHRMPGMSGVELLSRAKTMYPLTVRIILSGYADVSTVSDAIKLGAVYKFLTKPWNSDELGATLQLAFDKYEGSLVD